LTLHYVATDEGYKEAGVNHSSKSVLPLKEFLGNQGFENGFKTSGKIYANCRKIGLGLFTECVYC